MIRLTERREQQQTRTAVSTELNVHDCLYWDGWMTSSVQGLLHPLTEYLSFWSSVCPSVYVSICLFVCLSDCISELLFACIISVCVCVSSS